MNASSVDFLALGDWGFVGSGLPNNQSAVADLMGSVAALGRPNFIVSVGDNVYDFGIDVPANASERWNVTWTDVYDAIPELQGIDWYSTLGNHDYGTVAGYCEDKSTNATCEATGGKPWFQVGTVTAPSGSRYFNDFNYHVPFGDKVELFFFNTVPMVTRWREKIDGYRAYKGEPPVDWMAIVDELDASLKASKAPVKIAVTHVSPFTYQVDDFAIDNSEMAGALGPVLKSNGVHLALVGDAHNLQHLYIQGINIVKTGSGGIIDPGLNLVDQSAADLLFAYDSSNGFVSVSVDESTLETTVKYYSVAGGTEPIYEFTTSEYGPPSSSFGVGTLCRSSALLAAMVFAAAFL